MGREVKTLLTIIECDECHEPIGTCRNMKWMPGKSVKHITCNNCEVAKYVKIKRLEKNIKELKTLLKLTDKALENVDKVDGM